MKKFGYIMLKVLHDIFVVVKNLFTSLEEITRVNNKTAPKKV
jgi:hypothetical protein